VPRFEQSHGAAPVIFEVEVRGAIVETVTHKRGQAPRYARTRYTTPAQAMSAYVSLIERKKKAKFVEAGSSRLLAPVAAPGSSLMVDELFRAGDPRVLDEVLSSTNDKKLGALAQPWFTDTRPEMRTALLRYVEDGCDRIGHRLLVKRLFKLAESKGDDELMARFMVAFDRLVRRFATNGRLVSDPTVPENAAGESERFSRSTRRYLARRAFRYFRKLGKSDPARVGRAMRIALPLYRDEHLDTPEKLLDAWSLVHALYAWSHVIVRDSRGVRVAPGRSLGELAPAPYWPAVFEGRDDLLAMLAVARSRTVRVWTIAWLRKKYGAELAGVDVATVRPLLASPHDEVALFGAELLRTARGMELLPIDEWLSLLRIESVDVAPHIVAAFEKNVAPKRVSLEQAIDLACARIAAVAELGLRWAKEKKPESPMDLAAVARIAHATVAHVRVDGAKWFLELLDASPHRKPEHLREMFDSRFPDVRALAIEHVKAKPLGESGIPLWFALLESPYDDVRAIVVQNAQAWQKDAGSSEIEHLASTVLLAVHRGASTKLVMLRRIAERAAERPAEAGRLLSIMSLALRSIRSPERVGALTAIARAAITSDEFRAAVKKHLPYLFIDTQVSA
jgi:hypothetical protein